VVQSCWLYWHCGSKCCEWCRWWHLRVPFICLFLSFLGRSGMTFSFEYLSLARVIMFYCINPNKMHMLQSLFYLTVTLHVWGITITHPQEHKQLYLQHLITVTL
jgi:hypothetical protein